MGGLHAAGLQNQIHLAVDGRGLARTVAFLFFALAMLTSVPARCQAQENYSAEFRTSKARYLQGEPVFCAFVFHNTSNRTLVFSYRFPTRAANHDLPGEPSFIIKDSSGRRLPDPAPHPCGGAQGTVVYGTVTLPPGRTHAELWLLDQWARFERPGKYTLAARRRIALKTVDAATNKVSAKPVAYAIARANLTLEILPSTPAERAQESERVAKLLANPSADGFAEAYLVASTLPQPAYLERLAALADAPANEHRWDPDQALEGLARLGTPQAWNAIVNLARDPKAYEPVRAYAILLLGEKADPALVPDMIKLHADAPDSLRDDVLRALGFFKSPRANQVLFDQLHSSRSNDRVNAILGLRNLESKDAVPALIASLQDPDDQVRQVANFALQSLTGQKMVETPRHGSATSKEQSQQIAKQWHDWWLKHEGNFQPVRAPACHDW